MGDLENIRIMIKHKMYSFIRGKLCYLPESFLRFIEGIFQLKLSYKYYNSLLPNASKTAICMIDGVVNHGGLSDRLQGILSTYYVSQQLGINFKIYFVSPFSLETYLVPNEVKWQISASEMCYNNKISSPIFIRSIEHKREKQRYKSFCKALCDSSKVQFHVYSNVKCFPDADYSFLFNKLFKPSKVLQLAIDFHLAKINTRYISITFRFQQLLGDFKERDFKILPLKERNCLIKKCIDIVKDLYSKNQFLYHCILVTSDSSTFLREISSLPYVYVIPGKVVHMAYTFNSSLDVYLKSFVDLYMIANASEIYSAQVGPMYDSGFPKLASKIYEKPFHLITKSFV